MDVHSYPSSQSYGSATKRWSDKSLRIGYKSLCLRLQSARVTFQSASRIPKRPDTTHYTSRGEEGGDKSQQDMVVKVRSEVVNETYLLAKYRKSWSSKPRFRKLQR